MWLSYQELKGMVMEQDSSHVSDHRSPESVKPLDNLDGKSGHLQLWAKRVFLPKIWSFFVPKPKEIICKAFSQHQIKYWT